MVDKRDVILGLLMFFVNLFWAISQQWSVTDLLWSLWISSLLVGYSYILVLEPVPAEPAFPWPWPPEFELWRPRR